MFTGITATESKILLFGTNSHLFEYEQKFVSFETICSHLKQFNISLYKGAKEHFVTN